MPRFASPVPAPSPRKAAAPAAAPQRPNPPRQPALAQTLQLRAAASRRAAAKDGAASGGGLPEGLKAGVEQLSGIAMDDVRVHRNSPEPAKLGALAYAQGRDIHLGPGQERHLPHEAWHVVQQKQGRVGPTMQMHGAVPVNDETGLEREANVMGDKALGLEASADPVQRVEAPPKGQMAHAVMQCLRLSGSNEFRGEPEDPGTIDQKQAAALAPLLPNEPFVTHVALVDLPGKGMRWVEILSGDVGWITNKAGKFSPRDTAEVGDADHGSESPAEEEPIDLSDVTATGLMRLPHDVLLLLFKERVTSLLSGRPFPNNIAEIYNDWRSAPGTYTRGHLLTQLGIQQKSAETVQLARTGNTYSYNTGYAGGNTGTNYNDVVYYRNTGGNIDFSVDPTTIIASYNKLSGDDIKASDIKWSDPLMSSSKVQMSTDLKDKTKGVMPSGKAVSLPKASRPQHFAIADMLFPNARGGKLTWHHLDNPYEMVLVDMRVHAKHGHNGGVHLWK